MCAYSFTLKKELYKILTCGNNVQHSREVNLANILCMKIRAFLAMTFWTVNTVIELKLDFVCKGIIPSRYLKLANPAMAARFTDFCILKTESMCDFAAKPHTREE